MAGVATALPQDTLVSATNPAGMAFIGNSFDVAVAFFSPSPRGYEANADFATQPVPGQNFSLPAGAFVTPGEYESDGDWFLVPSFGYNRELNADSTIGISVYGNGGMNTEYNERPVLRDVSVELRAGETLVVLGPNGAGKTTLLRILATLLRATSGAVELMGAELPREAWKARPRLGYLGHQPLLYRELSVRENLEFNARLHGIGDAAARIDELLECSGLGRRGAELVRNLSAGMAQRAAICRALVHAPELLLLDEPDSHLDAGAGAIVEDLLGPAAGRTRVIVTHEVERGLEQADVMLLLRADGVPAHSGPVASISPGDVRAVYSGAVR
jgi:ABC-type multidrug transport system ATPase subunit